MKSAILFCHIDTVPSNTPFSPELLAQYQQLYAYAVSHGYIADSCIFHTGTLDFSHPDAVLLRFFSQINTQTIVIAETQTFFPAYQWTMIPYTQAYFIREKTMCWIGNKEFHTIDVPACKAKAIYYSRGT